MLGGKEKETDVLIFPLQVTCIGLIFLALHPRPADIGYWSWNLQTKCFPYGPRPNSLDEILH